MVESAKRDHTWLGSVVVLDMVQYGIQMPAVQARWKRSFNELLTGVIQEWPVSEQVILLTEKGATICFLSDPERAMFCALHLITGVADTESSQANPLRLRVGINLGPVNLVKDSHGHLSAVGEGISTGQRVMSFAGDNQILVARSFYEVASAISESYAGLFKSDGVRKDKHGRELAMYQLHPPDPTRSMLGADTAATPHTVSLTAAHLLMVENQLAAIIGPIAPHLLRITMQHSETAGELSRKLLGFIASKADQKRFLEGCRGIFPAGRE